MKIYEKVNQILKNQKNKMQNKMQNKIHFNHLYQVYQATYNLFRQIYLDKQLIIFFLKEQTTLSRPSPIIGVLE